MNNIQKILLVCGMILIGYLTVKSSHSQEIDASKSLELELERMAHQYSIEVISIMQQYLPAILDEIATDLRLEADKKYKCKLLEDTKIEDDC